MQKIGIELAWALLLMGIAWHDSSYAATKSVTTEHFVIEYEGVSAETVDFVARDAEQAFRDVTSYLAKRHTGPKIAIQISGEYIFPISTAADATIRLPSNRLSLTGADTGPPAIRGRAATLWHSVTNIVAPSGQTTRKLARFLSDGLGACMQDKFGGRKPTPWPAKWYPSMGKDLHSATTELAAEIGLMPLKDAVEQTSVRRLTRARRLGFLQAGSFVCFLLQTRSVARYMKWHEGAKFGEAYGVEISVIEKEWAGFIRSYVSR